MKCAAAEVVATADILLLLYGLIVGDMRESCRFGRITGPACDPQMLRRICRLCSSRRL